MARPANLIKAISGILKGDFFEKRIQVKQTPDGMVGLFRAKDGNAYTIQISAIKDSKYKGIFKEVEKK